MDYMPHSEESKRLRSEEHMLMLFPIPLVATLAPAVVLIRVSPVAAGLLIAAGLFVTLFFFIGRPLSRVSRAADMERDRLETIARGLRQETGVPVSAEDLKALGYPDHEPFDGQRFGALTVSQETPSGILRSAVYRLIYSGGKMKLLPEEPSTPGDSEATNS